MSLNDLYELAEQMGVDPDKEVEILLPDGQDWDFTSRFGMQRAADGGLYITPERIYTAGR
jgi:hypothetical protein